MTNKSTLPADKRFTHILAVAAWFGLLCGFGDVFSLMLLNGIGWKNIDLSLVPEMVWITPLFTMILFAGAGVALAIVELALPVARDERVPVSVFAFLTVYDWLRLIFVGHLARYAGIALAVGLTVTFLRWADRHSGLRFWRRSWAWSAALLVLAFVVTELGLFVQERMAIAELPPAPAGSPNILLIVVDTLRADHLSGYGYARPTSPNLDRIAQQGVVFENAFSASSWTFPSHASLLTGLYPHEHGAELNVKSFQVRRLTIGEALMARGYRTGAFSANKDYFSRSSGFGRGFVHFEDYSSLRDMIVVTPYARRFYWGVLSLLGAQDPWERKRAPEVNRAVLRWIDLDRDRPFFAFLNYYDVHWPYMSLLPYRNQFSKNSPDGTLNGSLERTHRQSFDQAGRDMDAYDGGVAYVDEYIARLLAELNKRGLSENTLVVITADHGESFGERGFYGHRNVLYREEIHVPLIFWGPRWVPAGVSVPQVVTNAALPATLIELAGGKLSIFPGPSLAQLWRGEPVPLDWPEPLAELAQQSWAENTSSPALYGWAKTLIGPQWQYIVHEKFGPQLYRWREDPKELKNLAMTPEGQVIVREFARRLQIYLAPRLPTK